MITSLLIFVGALAAIVGWSACALSSQISREEERHEGDL